jgi:hypothetical protein
MTNNKREAHTDFIIFDKYPKTWPTEKDIKSSLSGLKFLR